MANEAEERARYIENLKSLGHRNIPINQDGFFLDMYQRFRWEGWQARAASPVSSLPVAFMCPEKCGCLWRDNHDGTMSLFGPSSKSCPKCEFLPLDKLIPLFAEAVAPVSAPTGPNVIRTEDGALISLHTSGGNYVAPVSAEQPTTEPTIECGEGEYKHLLRLDVSGNLKQLVIEFLKWDGGEGSRAYDAHKYRILRDALRTLAAAPSVASELECKCDPPEPPFHVYGCPLDGQPIPESSSVASEDSATQPAKGEHDLLRLSQEFVRVIEENWEMPEENVFEGVMNDWFLAWLKSFKREIAKHYAASQLSTENKS